MLLGRLTAWILLLLLVLLLLRRYRMDWKREEAQKNILRTHTTAVSARMLYKLAQQVRWQRTKPLPARPPARLTVCSCARVRRTACSIC